MTGGGRPLLPGVAFDVAPARAGGGLPRMDVAGFAGLAGAGPFDVPVLVEDELRFREVFGADVRLTDQVDGEPATWSVLGPTVASFFAAGGRRCWVVRVGAAAEAVTTRFAVPGLVAVSDPGDPSIYAPVVLSARSPGSAFDGHRATAWLTRRPLALLEGGVVIEPAGGRLVIGRRGEVAPGQLLELRTDVGVLWVPVADVEPTGFGRLALRWEVAAERWLARSGAGTRTAGLSARLVEGGAVRDLDVERFAVDGTGAARLTTPTLSEPVAPGALLLVRDGTDQHLLTIEACDLVAASTALELRGRTCWQLLTPATRTAAGDATAAAVLTVGLAALEGEGRGRVLEGMDVVPGAPRWLGHLPCDDLLFGRAYRRAASGDEHPRPGPLDADVLAPRLDLAAAGDLGAVLPFGLQPDPAVATPGSARHDGGSRARRDGLDAFDIAWFADPSLRHGTAASVAQEAAQRFSIDGRPLSGCHALLPLAEVAVIAAPDGLHPGWHPVTAPAPVLLAPPVLHADDTENRLTWTPEGDGGGAANRAYVLERAPSPAFATDTVALRLHDPRWSAESHGCDRRWHRVRVTRGADTSPWSNTVALSPSTGAFAPCTVVADAVPVLALRSGRTVTWSLDPPEIRTGEAEFELATSTDALFASAEVRTVSTVQANAPTRAVVAERGEDVVHVRVRLAAGGVAVTAWSNTVSLVPAPTTARVSRREIGVQGDAVELHRVLGVLAAARRDLTALVSFPEGYEPAEVLGHLAALRDELEVVAAGRDPAAHLHAHHPWVQVVGEAPGRWVPVDGAIAGTLAATARSRGAWIASTTRPLDELVDVRTRYGTQALLDLRGAQVNVVRKQRDGVDVVGVDTLTDDPAVLPVTVRRLLILLRRLALREGAVAAFEGNGPLLWRVVRQRFEALLGDLHRRGALAGRRGADGFRVICDASTTTPVDRDAGRLVVELHVAPSRPLEYLVVRLTQADAGGVEITGAA